jgi:hypothetical protein
MLCALSFFPFAHTKAHKLHQIINHYTEEKATMENVVDLNHYKLWIAKKNVEEKLNLDSCCLLWVYQVKSIPGHGKDMLRF